MEIDGTDPVAAARNFLVFQKELGVTDVPMASPAADPPDLTERSDRASDLEADSLKAFELRIQGCSDCGLCEGRNHVVFGGGNPTANIVFVGEAPGREEDLKGLPFVGAAGELLTKMIAGIHLDRQDVYIANIIKCRPPGNRDPQADEIERCEPHLLRQIELIQPSIICALGRFAAQTLLKSTTSIGRLRGKVYSYNGIKLIPTYHPAALLRNSQWKRPTWEDLKRLRFEYDGTQI